jgi:hypothetical protein
MGMKRGTAKRETALCPFDSSKGRFFDFTKFESLGRAFIAAFARAFVLSSSSLAASSATSRYNSSCRFLRWLVTNQRNLLQLVQTLRSDHTRATSKDWEDAVELWKDSILNEPKYKPGSKYTFISNMIYVLKKIAIFGVIPKLVLLVPSTKLRKAARPRRTLVELSRQDNKEDKNAILKSSLGGTGNTNFELEAQKDFLVSLSDEEGRIIGATEEHAKSLMKINAQRLALIRACACKDFKKWRDHFLEGQRLLQSCDMTFEEIEAILCRQYSSQGSKGAATKSVFPARKRDVSISRLLTFFRCHPEYRGRILGHGQKENILKWLYEISSHFGSLNSLQAYLYPHSEMTNAVFVIIMCDTGCNLGVASTLHVNCLEKAQDPAYKILKGTKMRARGKLIVDELPIKDPINEISCVKAIETYQRMSEGIRRLATSETAQSLFLNITRTGGSVYSSDTRLLCRYFERFCERHSELRGLNIRPTMIRPSILLQAAFDKETGIIASASVGDHASMSTTFGYVSRYPIRIIWERKIREFQALFQAVSIYSIQGAAKKLGLTIKQVEKLFNEASRTGLGVACLNPRAGVQPGSKVGDICTQLQNCPTCSNMFVVATVENLKDLILWNNHLEQSRSDWEANRPERWEKIWLPWLVFTEVAIEQANRGRIVKAFIQAKTIAEELIARKEVNLPPLW